jgi:hypothetical protein
MQQATWQYLCREFGSPQPAEIHLLLYQRCSGLLGTITADSIVHQQIYGFERIYYFEQLIYYFEQIY